MPLTDASEIYHIVFFFLLFLLPSNTSENIAPVKIRFFSTRLVQRRIRHKCPNKCTHFMLNNDVKIIAHTLMAMVFLEKSIKTVRLKFTRMETRNFALQIEHSFFR